MKREGVTQEELKAMADNIRRALRPGEITQLVRLIGPTPNTGEMSADEFEDLVERLKAKGTRRGYSDTSIAAARLVFVMGATMAEAAAELGVTRAAVGQSIQRMRRQMDEVPKGWVPVSLWLPEAIAGQLESIAASLRADPPSNASQIALQVTTAKGTD